ncbi:hypothetical protein AAFF_G00167240 [Aldrovandia affinis]|uniref:Uncharacterized protein n=1 Tax=Aldrovandia affinis TaxID=143900 RepID=A0AAD7W806_9TELE|nr:hypothetical protein AAFF_G00167240 [Aldrovandia affinis]
MTYIPLQFVHGRKAYAPLRPWDRCGTVGGGSIASARRCGLMKAQARARRRVVQNTGVRCCRGAGGTGEVESGAEQGLTVPAVGGARGRPPCQTLDPGAVGGPHDPKNLRIASYRTGPGRPLRR